MKDIQMLAAAGAISPSLGPREADSPDSGSKPAAMGSMTPLQQVPRAVRAMQEHSPEVEDITVTGARGQLRMTDFYCAGNRTGSGNGSGIVAVGTPYLL